MRTQEEAIHEGNALIGMGAVIILLMIVSGIILAFFHTLPGIALTLAGAALLRAAWIAQGNR